MSKCLLSIGIIFKNDIRCIERCLKSLEPLRKAIPCELVMADTGSTDGSRAVAEQYADQVFDFPWIKDFAAARNAVLDRCVGEWCLTVDTDEWLDPDCKELVAFLKSKQRDQCDRGSLVVRNYQDKKMRAYGDFFAERLGRRCGGELRYQGAIHETFIYHNRETQGCRLFPRVILHHDGYTEVESGHWKRKRRRNMELLRVELEKRPNDLHLLGQCMDSAETDQEKRKYADRTMELLRGDPEDTLATQLLDYRRCMEVFYSADEMSRALECYHEWKRCCDQSATLHVDGEAMAAIAEYHLENYSSVLEHLNAYSQGLQKKEKGLDLQSVDRIFSQYNTDNWLWRSNLKAIEFDSLCRLERYSGADELLSEVQPEKLRLVDRGGMALEALKQAQHLPQCPAFLCRCWDFYQDDAHWTDPEEMGERQKGWADLVKMLQMHLEKTGQTGQELLAQMGDRAPGRSARICLTDDAQTIAAEWAVVTDWERMLPQAYRHTMDLRMPFPEAFYRQKSEQMDALATALAAQPGFARMALDWLTHTAPAQTAGELIWQLDLVTAALRTPKWHEDAELGEGLCGLYLALSATYLDNIYNPELLTEEDIHILPGMHRFGWYCRQAMAALEQGDELGYVRSLRAGLDTAPAMKDMVNFLLEHKPKTAAQIQLEQLAGQVQAILAQYDPNDPAVTALKASPAYQQVAHLLEPQQAPAPAEEPVSPKPLEEALAGSRKEIEESIRKNIDRWGAENAKARVDYWEKYPLWGKDKDTVVANMTTALADHGADFRWLFDRLGDEQSRRILTAVVRNWRFFELEPLGQVKDTTYDDYFDLALLHCDDNEVVADLGAFVGDTFLSYVKNYGSMAYRRYYCYEITKESVEQLKKNTAEYPRVAICRKGAGSEPGTMTLSEGSDASANGLTAAEAAEQADTVEIVPLDQDITGPVTLIKMDIKGSEQSALQGCVRHIREDRPKLALSLYHNFEDIWKLPRMIEELVPGYRFYLRYHGGNLWPSEISLLALPPEN